MKALSLLMCLYLLFRPYYFFSSGSIQISDIFLLLGFCVFLIYSSRYKKHFSDMVKGNKKFLIFIIFTIIINLIYFIVVPDFRFLLSSLYYIFGFCAIVLFSYCVKNEKYGHRFLRNIESISVLNLVIQAIIYFMKIGKYWHYGSRYMGTFNDPNQFGYYVLLSFALIYLIEMTKKKNNALGMLLVFILTLFLIAISQSTAMMFGAFVFVALSSVRYVKKIPGFLKKNIKSITAAIMIIAMVFLAVFSLLPRQEENGVVSKIVAEISITERIEQKIFKMNSSSDDDVNIFQDRALDYIGEYPECLVVGCGEGAETRFTNVHHYTEIHSTLPAMFFYYGVIPFSFVLAWIYSKLKKIDKRIMVVYIAVIAESFFLANQRQALFWVIIALAPYINVFLANKDNRVKEDQR